MFRQNVLAETKKFLANYQRAREILEEICEITRAAAPPRGRSENAR